MRILALVSSYRKHGNTSRIVQMIRTHLEAIAARCGEPLEFEALYLGHMDLRPCQGCRVCFDKGEEKCPLKDDLLTIKAKMHEADGLLVAGPVYVNDVSGIAKNWIDRLAHVCHRPEFADKCVYQVATTGASPTGHTLLTMSIALRTWGFYVAGQAGFRTGALMSQAEMETCYQRKTERIANKLFLAIRKRRFARPSFLSLLTFRVQQRVWQRASDEPFTHDYWQNRGWLDPRREYYIPHQVNRMKVALARFVGAFVARLLG